MTFFASKHDDGKRVNVHTTYGPIEIKVAEDTGHARSFAQELIRRCDEIEAAATVLSTSTAQA